MSTAVEALPGAVASGDAPFSPPAWMRGGHRQTLLGYLYRRRLRWTLPAEDLVVEPEEGVRLLARATWQGERTLVLVHGLGGHADAPYMIATGLIAVAAGWSVVRVNMRGAGDSAALCARLYHAGLDTDLLTVLRAVAARSRHVAVAGFSLGGNLALLALGRRAADVPEAVRAAIAVCPPLDLAACAASIDRAPNRLYQAYFLRNLRAGYRWRQQTLHQLYAPGREAGVRSIREFDAAITAPYGGFRDVDDYYTRSSAGPHLAAVDRPALVLAAEDDPMVPAASLRAFGGAPRVRIGFEATGGHLGFVGPPHLPGRFWAGERIVAFAGEHLGP